MSKVPTKSVAENKLPNTASSDRPAARKWSAGGFLFLGLLSLAILVGGFGSWAAFSQISGSIISSGRIEVDQNRQVVGHTLLCGLSLLHLRHVLADAQNADDFEPDARACVEALLRHGGDELDVCARDAFGRGALWEAADKQSDSAIVELLTWARSLCPTGPLLLSYAEPPSVGPAQRRLRALLGRVAPHRGSPRDFFQVSRYGGGFIHALTSEVVEQLAAAAGYRVALSERVGTFPHAVLVPLG